MGTRTRFLRAMAAPLRMASGTSLALPRPAPPRHDDGAETETAAALDDFGDTVDVNNLLGELQLTGVDVIRWRRYHALRPQNFRPASRAASASALTRPWY